jgi:hypothetical protein
MRRVQVRTTSAHSLHSLLKPTLVLTGFYDGKGRSGRCEVLETHSIALFVINADALPR